MTLSRNTSRQISKRDMDSIQGNKHYDTCSVTALGFVLITNNLLILIVDNVSLMFVPYLVVQARG